MADRPRRHPDLGDPEENFLMSERLKQAAEKHLGTPEEIAFHQRMGRVTKVDLDEGTFMVKVSASEKDLRRIARYMFLADVVRVVLPESVE